MAGFLERVAVAAKAAVGIFSDRSSQQALGLLAGMWPAGAGEAPVRGARERLGAYADMPWVYACADKVAFAVASVAWRLAATRRRGATRAHRDRALQRAYGDQRRAAMKAAGEAGELLVIESHPMLDLLEAGNAMMTGLAVRHVTALHWDLEGEAFWMKERHGLTGAPVAIWPLPPDWIRSTPTPSAREYRVSFRGWQGAVPETEILWMPKHNPSNPYGRGTGIARALADELETDEYAARTVRMSFLNQARPDFLVYPGEGSAEWSEPEVTRLRENWAMEHEGFWRAFRPRFASQKLGIHEFAHQDFRRLQLTQIREFERDVVRQTWGIPPEIMGIVEPGASRATIQRADYILSRYVTVPRLEMLRAILQERLVPEYDDRLIVEYVSPVQDDQDFALEVGKAAPWAWTADEWRALARRAPLPDGAGRVHLVPINLESRVSLEPVEPLDAGRDPLAGPP